MGRRIVSSSDEPHGGSHDVAREVASHDVRRADGASGADGTRRTRTSRSSRTARSRTASGTAGVAGPSSGDDTTIAERQRSHTARTVSSAGERAGARHGGNDRTGARRNGTAIREGFVDARRMPSEDVVSKTLRETAGTLGIPTRPKVVDFSARLKEHRRANARIIAVRVAAGVAALGVAVALIWLLFFSTVFRLETANISVTGGNEWVSRSQILAIADKQSGKSLLLVSSHDVVAQLTNIPGVTEAGVSKRFPNGLSVSVKAQQPAAMLKDSGSQMVAVDSKARVLNKVGGASTDGIPVIQVRNVDSALGSAAVKEALTILGSLPDSMRASITKVTAATQDSITTELNGGEHVVVWGDSSDLELKQAIVDKILGDPKVIGDKTQVDVSAPSRPIIK